MIKILSAIDTSEHAATVMEYSCFIAPALNARVTGMCVIETKKIEGPLLRDYLSTVGLDAGLDYKGTVKRFLQMKSEELLERFRAECAAREIEFDAVIDEGIVTRSIASHAESVDLVILGRRGEHAEWHASPLGGAVEGVIRSTPQPVLITPRKFRPIRRAMIAYDGSAFAKDAFELAARIHRATRLEGIVVTAQPERDEDELARVEAEVRELCTKHESPFRFEAREGDAAQVIPKAARELEVDLVVMGAYGHSKIREMILGSTTQQVLLSTTDVPLLLRR